MAGSILRKGSKVFQGPRVEVKLFGQWEDAMRVLATMGPVVKSGSIKAQIKVGKEIQRRVKAHLRNQDLGWRALDSDYAKRKDAAGLDSRILTAYGTYYNNIDVWQKGSQHLVMVGVKKGVRTWTIGGKRSKLDVATIAYIHEFGGSKVPRRALWNPTIQEMGGAAGVKKIFVKSLFYWMRMNRIPVKLLKRIF
jgi:hypothetical protein